MVAKSLIYAVLVVEFDEDKGPVVREVYPSNTKLAPYDESEIAELALPDGLHQTKQDSVFMILHMPKEVLLYGIGVFKSVEDLSLKRRARQATCVVLANKPFFAVFEPFLVEATGRYLDKEVNNKGLLRELHTALSHIGSKHTLSLWGRDYHLSIKDLEEDQFDNASLTKLVEEFRVDTMVLWYALIRQERVLFSGRIASRVAHLCLAAPLLVAPLKGFTRSLCPYLPLRFLDSPHDVFPNTYPSIVGVANQIIEEKTSRHDVVASVFESVCVIHNKGIRVSGRDKHFIKNVISGIADKRGEAWVRDQFRRRTEEFIRSLADNKLLTESQKKYVGPASDRPFTNTTMYKQYVEAMQHAPAAALQVSRPSDLMRQLHNAEPGVSKNLLWKQFLDSLQDIADIEEVVDANGVALVAKAIFSSDSTERKYSVSILAAMAITIKGQVAILSENLLPRILEMVSNENERPNVRTAACGCLQKISTLFIGAKAIADQNALTTLTNIICTVDFNNLTLKANAAYTLLRVYRLLPSLPPQPPTRFVSQLDSSDTHYTALVVQLLDIWQHNAVNRVLVPEELATTIAMLSAMGLEREGVRMVPDLDLRLSATVALQADLVRRPYAALQLVAGGAILRLWENLQLASRDHKLCLLSFDALSVIADSYAGSCEIHRLRMVETVVSQGMDGNGPPEYVFRVLRFLEIASQHRALGSALIKCGGVQKLVGFVRHNHNKDVRMLCVLALSALRYLLRFQPAEQQEALKQDLTPLHAVGLLSSPHDQRAAELAKMVRLVLYLARIGDDPMPEDVLVNEFYQTLGRRCKVLNAASPGIRKASDGL